MHKIIITMVLISIGISTYCQSDFLQIETNKTLSIFSFLETASNQRSISKSFKELIDERTKGDDVFRTLVDEYVSLQLEYFSKRQEYPDSRYAYLNTKDLLWIASSNSKSIDDFNSRIVGVLPHNTHSRLISVMRKIEPYYNDMVWDAEQENIKRMKAQLDDYKSEIEELYIRISKFYGIAWDKEIPFKIALYPIPLEKGYTTALPKGNVLICSFLSHNDEDYLGRLGVIIHEMCHILFAEQPKELQHQIDSWFENNKSDFSSLAYSYLDEGLATALGNGWAYKQLHGVIDTAEWYNNKYIDGFAHALYPLTEEYMSKGNQIDSNYIDQSIDIFQKTFPKAIYNTHILMNELLLYANSENEEEINIIITELRSKFNIRSYRFSTPISAEQSTQSFKEENVTKFFIVDSNHNETLNLLNNNFPNLNTSNDKNTIQSFFDEETKSHIIVLNIDNLEYLEKGLHLLSEVEYLDEKLDLQIE